MVSSITISPSSAANECGANSVIIEEGSDSEGWYKIYQLTATNNSHWQFDHWEMTSVHKAFNSDTETIQQTNYAYSVWTGYSFDIQSPSEWYYDFSDIVPSWGTDYHNITALTAYFTEIPFTSVSLWHMNGTGGTSSITATYGSPMPAIELPTREGYAFGGYFTEINGQGVKYYNSDGSSARNWDNPTDVLYAYWSNLYTITFNANGGSNPPASITDITSGESVPLPSSSENPTWTNHTFLGWSENSEATEADPTYTPGLWIVVTRDITLYAVWRDDTPTTYTITLEVDPPGAGIATGGGQYEPNQYITITATPSSNTYVFLRWERNGTSVSTQSSMSVWVTEDATYTAKFQVPDASLVYDAMGGFGAPDTDYYAADMGTVISDTVPTYEGHVFLGWALNSSDTMGSIFPGDTFRDGTSGSHTIYAIWTNRTGNILSVEHKVNGESPETSIATGLASWTIDDYVLRQYICHGQISWTLSGITAGYVISSIDFYSGSTELDEHGYVNSGTLNSVRWDIETPPDKMVVNWTYSGQTRTFSVSALNEDGESITSSEGTAVIKQLDRVIGATGNFADYETITLTAIPGAGWKFLYWRKDGDSENASEDAQYTIVVSEDNAGHYNAYFKDAETKYPVTLTITPSAAAQSAGVSVSGEGSYGIGEEITFIATSNDYYQFKMWRMKGYSFSKEQNPYTFKLSAADVETTTDWLAVFEASTSSAYQVLTRVNVSNGTLTKNPNQNSFPISPPTDLTLTASVTSGNYACLYLNNSQNERIENSHLAYLGFQSGMTYTYTVNADTVWTAYFARYITVTFDYNTTDPVTGGRQYGYAFPGKTYGFNELLPTPTREGYYFKEWSTASSGGERVDNDTPVPSNAQSIILYAQWTSLNTKYLIQGLIYPETGTEEEGGGTSAALGAVSVSAPTVEGTYFRAGDTCRMEVTKEDGWIPHLYLYVNTEAKTSSSNVWTEISTTGSPFEFTVGDNSNWEYQESGDEESDIKRITIRFVYENKSVPVTLSWEPSDNSLGTLEPLDHARYLPTDYFTVTAIPKVGGSVVRWEQKIRGEDWHEEIGSGNTCSFSAGEGGSQIRCIFGEQGTLTYVTNSSTTIPPQNYKTNQRFNISSTIPEKSGYVFIGWADSDSASVPQFLPGEQVSFTTTSTTLYGKWYQTPQSITHIYNLNASADYDPYIPPQGTTITAQVSDITRTSQVGVLQGTLSWSVVLPSGISDITVSKIGIGSSGSGSSDIYESTDSQNSGVNIQFNTLSSISSDWSITVFYNTGTMHYAYFNANGGENAPDRIAFSHGQSFKIPLQQPTYAGHVFLGWTTEPGSTTVEYRPGDTYEGISPDTGFSTFDDIIFYAVWAAGISITVVYRNNTTGVEGETPVLADATVWVSTTTEAEGSVYVNTIHWDIANVRNGYTLAKMRTIVVTSGAGTVIATGEGESGNAIYRTMSGGPTNAWTATINFTQQAYTLTYDTAGGSPEISPQTVPITDNTVTISNTVPRKPREKFLGWAKNAGAVVANFQPGERIPISSDMTIYAVYEDEEGSDDSPYDPETEFTIYAKPDDIDHGSVSPTRETYEAGASITLTANPAQGYTFSYWKNASSGTTESTDAKYTFTGTASLNGTTFIAVFTAIDIKITSQLIYYVPTNLLMSFGDTLIWDDDGLVGCGDGADTAE